MRGRVFYPEKNQEGCLEFSDSDFNHDHIQESKIDGHKPIIMVDRGTCHFVNKVLNI